jgi:hypothetical protein
MLTEEDVEVDFAFLDAYHDTGRITIDLAPPVGPSSFSRRG